MRAGVRILCEKVVGVHGMGNLDFGFDWERAALIGWDGTIVRGWAGLGWAGVAVICTYFWTLQTKYAR